jgi:site-specific DNA-methyltransferase (adenine-specific)
MNIQNLRIADLTPDPQNARQHDDKNLKAIQGSLKEFGQRKPIVVTEAGVIVAGNGTVEAAKRLGWTQIDVVKVPNDWTPDKIKAFAIADNRTAELANWNQEVLTSQLLELEAEGWELAEFGFEALELPDEDKPIVEDEVPESAPGRVALGDIWQLGNHRLMCGDSFSKDAIDQLLNGHTADMVFSDPPYGMNLDTDYSKMGDGGKKYSKVIDDNKQFDASFLLDYFSKCKEIFLWGADYYVETLGRDYPDLGSWIIWDKYSDDRIGLLDGRFGSSFETCWSKTPHRREIARVLVKTNYTARGDEARVHPTQKPVELAKWFFDRWGKQANNIVDLFGGSGFTLIACEQLGKSAFLMELDPKYCDVIIERWERLTGNKAELLPAKAD